MNPEERPAPGAFDEARALAELERLRAQIIEARAARGRVEDEFEAFVRGFRSQRYREETPHEVPAPPEPGFDAGSIASDPIGSEAGTPDTARRITTAVARLARLRGMRGTVVVLIAAVVLGGAVFAALALRKPISPAPGRSSAAATTEGQPPSRAAVLPVPDPPGPAGIDMELRTLRRVWVRVTIDGRRAFERELAADQRIPLHAARTIQIRAGDAGAVALTRDGLDAGPLGRDGTIATREFTADMPVR